ncbi:putative anion transporter 4, chloroplastic [Porphyridium purpureum]|uniref:Putative anion transporter 4, chloroplastic n=1 Tax=Porphyridium purpureum TaxID=35688 RepID=A0A5J4Z5D1_PORPP|nr:putative anion transporter 4, chloroplastic [Porphyridium purpureum]|eukprot:POR5713..scf295_1
MYLDERRCSRSERVASAPAFASVLSVSLRRGAPSQKSYDEPRCAQKSRARSAVRGTLTPLLFERLADGARGPQLGRSDFGGQRALSSSKMKRKQICSALFMSDSPEGRSLLEIPKPAEGSSADANNDMPRLTTANVLNPAAWPERYKVVFMTFISFIICNMDRINVSIAILPMAKTYGWSQSTVGIIQSSFFWGYVLTQIPGGYLASRFGGKAVLGAGVVAWSLMTFITPMAASHSLPALLVARALLGIGEGVAMPAMNQMISSWVPSSERSRSLSLIYSGMYLGSVVGLLLCPQLIISFGWPSVFYTFGALGFVWWAGWLFGIGSSPEACAGISDAEKRFILDDSGNSRKEVDFDANDDSGDEHGNEESSGSGNRVVALQDGSIPWLKFFQNPAVWAINISHFCVTWGYFVLLTWLPTFFTMELGFDLSSSSLFAIIPWLAMFVFANVGGQIADRLLTMGLSRTLVRKTMQTIGFLGPAAFLTLVASADSAMAAVTYMSFALGLGSFSQSGVYSNHQDIGPRYAGILLGISNTFAAVPGIVGVALTGVLLDSTGGNWNVVFGIAVGFYLLGTIVYNSFASGERQFE